MTDLVRTMKLAALGAVEAGKPVEIAFGTVASADPLAIAVEQKLVLGAAQLTLARNVTDYAVEMSVDHLTEAETEHTHAIADTFTGGGASSPTAHAHAYRGRKTFIVHNALKEGEAVILLRAQGGQKYIVWDRLG
jgi:hypothetical protein